MKKALLLIKDDLRAQEFQAAMRELEKEANERKTFLLKQSENMVDEFKKRSKLLWTDFEDYLIARQITPPNFDRKRDNLCVSDEAGCVFVDIKDGTGQHDDTSASHVVISALMDMFKGK